MVLRAVDAHGVPDEVDVVTELLQRVGRGDEQAFRDLYDHTSAWVYGIVLRVVRDPSMSEEVAQEVLVDVWRHATRFDARRGSGKAWIMTMAHRRGVDRVRSAQASVQRDHKVATRDYHPAHDQVSEAVVSKLDRERVHRVLATLTPLQREAIEMAYFKGFTQREVAEKLNVPLGTVKTRMRDGMIRMRDEMGFGQ